jgi:hypothetical protein
MLSGDFPYYLQTSTMNYEIRILRIWYIDKLVENDYRFMEEGYTSAPTKGINESLLSVIKNNPHYALYSYEWI